MSRYASAHADPQGPGDARPTALQIVEDEGLIGKLAGKVVLVTGANAGIGAETARAIHAAGATLFLTARDSAKAQQAVDGVVNGPGPKSGAPVHAIELRLDSLASVRAAAEAFFSKSDDGRLNLLILNAGVMATPEGRTEDGFETQFGTNHLGHFLLFQLLKPALLAATSPDAGFQSRVVSVSSLAHHFGKVRLDDLHFEKDAYEPWAAYGQSKTANLYFASELERRYGPRGLHALSLHPGVIATGLFQHLPQDEMELFNNDESMQKTMKSVPQGAATTVYAALSKEWEGRGGRYLADLVEQGPAPESGNVRSGYAPWAYDEAAAKELWEKSNKLVGLEED
ncbi:WW domain-containing oxidoreductase [Colletotrichum tanaceti]|uniref:WW domain-containing oxidoreductase n=1 Tax=Colletotrichum tanaceti TaxID=1306861 RepID=A0A4U6XTB4_9PEZI|nr:WW domain-containing oxidoreductase [Colletotrichum tanaceti]TKW59101.1 WW domain-containing oxidoreductase [Colletotrichum tanaceti]